MKTLELDLKKKILIVEFEDNNHIENIIGLKDLKMEWDNGEEIKLICKGSELTEEIAKDLVNSPDNFQFLDAENTFIGDIEKGGYYWGENPVKHPEDFDDLPSSLSVYVDAENKHFEAELKTFNPEKTLIFEIL